MDGRMCVSGRVGMEGSHGWAVKGLAFELERRMMFG